MRLFTVMCENFANWATLTVWDWLFLLGFTGGWLFLQRKWYKRKW